MHPYYCPWCFCCPAGLVEASYSHTLARNFNRLTQTPAAKIKFLGRNTSTCIARGMSPRSSFAIRPAPAGCGRDGPGGDPSTATACGQGTARLNPAHPVRSSPHFSRERVLFALSWKRFHGTGPSRPPPAPRGSRGRSLPTCLVLVDAQSHGDALEGPLVARPHSLGRPAGLGRVAGPGPAALGGHEGAAGDALAEPGEEQPELEGDETEQGEGGEERVREVVQVPLVRGRRRRRPRRRHRGRRPGRRGGRGAGGRRRGTGAGWALLLPSAARRIHSPPSP